jgi:phytoene dehydrogenase-like protein
MRINGTSFCAGPQFIWDFGDSPEMVGTRVLRFLGLDQEIEMLYLDEDGQDRFFLGDEGFVDVPTGLDRFREVMVARFPHEQSNLDMFFQYLQSLSEGSRVVLETGAYLEGRKRMMSSVPPARELTFRAKKHIARTYDKTLFDLFEMCGLSARARRLLYGHGAIFALSPQSVSVSVYAAATGSILEGAYIPKHGMVELVNSLASTIAGHGGSVTTGKRVTRLSVSNGRVLGVACADGSQVDCDLVISTLSPRLTCSLIPGCRPGQFMYRPSNSLVSCFLQVSGFSGVEKLARRNYWWQAFPEEVDYLEPDMEAEPTMLFANSVAASGVAYEGDAPGVQGLTVFAPGNFAQALSAFQDSPERHDQLKAIIADRVISQLDRRLLPGIQRAVKTIQVHTPLDLFHELGAEAGNVYGRRADVDSVLKTAGEIPGVDNLHITCATVGQAGVATAFQTALLLVDKLTGIRL